MNKGGSCFVLVVVLIMLTTILSAPNDATAETRQEKKLRKYEKLWVKYEKEKAEKGCAAKALMKAAKKLPKAAYHLAKAFETGEECHPRNPVAAYYWYSKAADKGHPEAVRYRSTAFKKKQEYLNSDEGRAMVARIEEDDRQFQERLAETKRKNYERFASIIDNQIEGRREEREFQEKVRQEEERERQASVARQKAEAEEKRERKRMKKGGLYMCLYNKTDQNPRISYETCTGTGTCTASKTMQIGPKGKLFGASAAELGDDYIQGKIHLSFPDFYNAGDYYAELSYYDKPSCRGKNTWYLTHKNRFRIKEGAGRGVALVKVVEDNDDDIEEAEENNRIVTKPILENARELAEQKTAVRMNKVIFTDTRTGRDGDYLIRATVKIHRSGKVVIDGTATTFASLFGFSGRIRFSYSRGGEFRFDESIGVGGSQTTTQRRWVRQLSASDLEHHLVMAKKVCDRSTVVSRFTRLALVIGDEEYSKRGPNANRNNCYQE